jgi:hypothetical protein
LSSIDTQQTSDSRVGSEPDIYEFLLELPAGLFSTTSHPLMSIINIQFLRRNSARAGVTNEVSVHRLASVILIPACLTSATASTIRIAITGATTGVYVEEGPIFGHSSYEHIPDGTPFTLIYTFDDHKGKETFLAVRNEFITESKIEDTESTAPGTNAILQIAEATWEFGPSTHSSVKLNTSPDNRRYELTFATSAKGNQISAVIQPKILGFWPTNADWRASFIATSLMESTVEFSANNGRVSAKGKLRPLTLTVSGVDVAGQWLTSAKIAGSQNLTTWKRQWHLAHPSPKGGYIVQEVSKTTTGAPDPGSAVASTTVRYWEAWRVPPHSTAPTGAISAFEVSASSGSFDTIFATARFYEDLMLPVGFVLGQVPYAGATLSSSTDPHLETNHATLPVTADTKLE